ncbi:MAG: dinuclear metal center YbgI/SA1388 family protein [Oleiphilaceae bacterium]|jgi:dinuclear metal center YbgI/SA1388 family protein
MTVSLKTLVSYLDEYLQANAIQDYCPNGLQVEGCAEVTKIIGGVTANQALIDYAITSKADAILVHHGFFWKGEDQIITGIKKKRIQSLLQNNISLIAYHLPLDVHPVLGNNAQLAKLLGLNITGPLEPSSKMSVGVATALAMPVTAKEFQNLISEKLGRDCLHIGVESKLIQNIGLCTGAAQGMITQAVSLELDAYLSGEISEPTVHIANETGVNYFSAGHHATERGGVMALGKHLKAQFKIDFEFKDLYNPV